MRLCLSTLTFALSVTTGGCLGATDAPADDAGGEASAGGSTGVGGTTNSGGTTGGGGTSGLGEEVVVGTSVGASCNGAVISEIRCVINDSTPSISLSSSDSGERTLILVHLRSHELGNRLLDAAASPEKVQLCGASSTNGPEACSVELLQLQRGETSSVVTRYGVEVEIELGSLVEFAVSCPDGLSAFGGDDVGFYHVDAEPNRFVITGRDCQI